MPFFPRLLNIVFNVLNDLLDEAKTPTKINVAFFQKFPQLMGFSDSFTGRNYLGEPQPSTHAEMALMAKAERLAGKKRGKHRKGARKSWHSRYGALVSLSLVYRKRSRKWEFQNAHPCYDCTRQLHLWGVKHVKFSDPVLKSPSDDGLHRLLLPSPEAFRNARVSTGYRIRGRQTAPRLCIAHRATFDFLKNGLKRFELRKQSPFALSLRKGQTIDLLHGHQTLTRKIKSVRRHRSARKALEKLGLCRVLPALTVLPPQKRMQAALAHYRRLYPARGFNSLRWVSFELY